MTPENDVFDDLLDQLDRIERGAAVDRAMLGAFPATLDDFEAMTAQAQSSSRALLKSFEQYVDTLQRAIRTQMRVTGYRLKGLTPVDIANKAEELEQVADAQRFHKLVELRNQLTHEYPDNPEVRFERLLDVLDALPFLDDAAKRVRHFASTRIGGQQS